MKGVRAAVEQESKDFEMNLQMEDISFHLNSIRNQSDNLAANKFDNLLEEGEIFETVFRELNRAKAGPGRPKLPISVQKLKDMML